MSQWSPEEFLKSTWQLNPRMELPHLEPPLVLWTLLQSDPLPGFRERLSRNSVPDFSGVFAPFPTNQFTPRQGYLVGTWDLAFREVTGDRVYQLVDDRKVAETPPGPDGEHGAIVSATFTAVSSNEPAGARWFVTKAVLHNGHALVWNIRVETEIGRMAKVILTSGNALDLEQEYQSSGRRD